MAYRHGGTIPDAIRERDQRIRELEANQRAPKRRWKTARATEDILTAAPGSKLGPSNRLRRLDARITRCDMCGAWTFDDACATPHTLMDEVGAARPLPKEDP